MGEEKKVESKDQMAGCSIHFPDIDESELLSDARSPRFLKACKQLRIDPLELCPKSFESFKGKDTSLELQQVRFAMYQRSRYQKWKAIKECKFSFSDNKDTEVSSPQWTLGNSWIGSELSKTGPIVQKGKSEVYMCCLKTLKETANQGAITRHSPSADSDENRNRKHDGRKDCLKKQNNEKSRKKELTEKIRSSQSEKEQAIKAREDAQEQRRLALLQAWSEELKQKKMAQIEHAKLVQSRIKQQSKGEGPDRSIREKGSDFPTSKLEFPRPNTSPLERKILSSSSSEDLTGRWRRERIAQRAAEQNKQLIAEYRRQQQDFERKVSILEDRAKGIAQSRKMKENELRKKIVNIRKIVKERLKDRAEETMEELIKADSKISNLKLRTKKALDIKVEMDRIRFEQVQERIERQRAAKESRLSELEQVHRQMDRDKEEREQTIQKLLRERQMISTQIRLQKKKVHEEILQIQQTKSWNRAQLLIQELKPSYIQAQPFDNSLLPVALTAIP